MDQETAMKLVAASISVLSEYLIGSTWKIQKATTSAIRLMISHGLGKQEVLPV
jgi:NADH:ubiquinone oxidoreductase subunit 4 (subunit M)